MIEFVGHIEPPVAQAKIVVQAKVGDADTDQSSEGGQDDDGGDSHDDYFLSCWDSFVPLQDYNITYWSICQHLFCYFLKKFFK